MCLFCFVLFSFLFIILFVTSLYNLSLQFIWLFSFIKFSFLYFFVIRLLLDEKRQLQCLKQRVAKSFNMPWVVIYNPQTLNPQTIQIWKQRYRWMREYAQVVNKVSGKNMLFTVCTHQVVGTVWCIVLKTKKNIQVWASGLMIKGRIIKVL